MPPPLLLLSLILSNVCASQNTADKRAKCVCDTSDKRQMQISGKEKILENTKTSPALPAASQRRSPTSPLPVQEPTGSCEALFLLLFLQCEDQLVS